MEIRVILVYSQEVLQTMLRTERDWFPRFKALCKETLTYRNRSHPDHNTMCKVIDCKSYRHVQSVILRSPSTNPVRLLRLVRKLQRRARNIVWLTHKVKRKVPYPSFLQHAQSDED